MGIQVLQPQRLASAVCIRHRNPIGQSDGPLEFFTPRFSALAITFRSFSTRRTRGSLADHSRTTSADASSEQLLTHRISKSCHSPRITLRKINSLTYEAFAVPEGNDHTDGNFGAVIHFDTGGGSETDKRHAAANSS